MAELSPTIIEKDALPGLPPEYRHKVLNSLRGLCKRLIRWRLLDLWGPYLEFNWVEDGKKLPFYFSSIGEDQCTWVNQTEDGFNFLDKEAWLSYCFWKVSSVKMELGTFPSDRALVGAVNTASAELLALIGRVAKQGVTPKILYLGDRCPDFDLVVEENGSVCLRVFLEMAVGVPVPPDAVVVDWRKAHQEEMKKVCTPEDSPSKMGA